MQITEKIPKFSIWNHGFKISVVHGKKLTQKFKAFKHSSGFGLQYPHKLSLGL